MDNFSTQVGKAICIIGVIGGLICGQVFKMTTIVGTSYLETKASYNFGLAISIIASMLIMGALFISLGQIHDALIKLHNDQLKLQYIQEKK